MAAEVVEVKIKSANGDYVIESTNPPGWLDMLRKFAAHDPLYLGIEIGRNLEDGILFKFEVD